MVVHWRTLALALALLGMAASCSSTNDSDSDEGSEESGGNDGGSGDGDGDGDGDSGDGDGDGDGDAPSSDGTTVMNDEDDTEPVGDDLVLLFSPMYSAYDGVHDFQLPAIVQGVRGARWSANPADAVDLAPDSDTGGIMITTRKPGEVQIIARAGELSGSATLYITDATPEDWEIGEMRYNNEIPFPEVQATDGGPMRTQTGFIDEDGVEYTFVEGGFQDPDGGMYTFVDGGYTGPDGGMYTYVDGGITEPDGTFRETAGRTDFELPDNLSCRNCHSSLATALDVEHTPQQTGGYSDDELIAIFTQGMKPESAGFHTPFPESIYVQFHTWEATEAEEKGIVVYLRSLTPKTQGPLDFMGLMQQFGGGGGN